MSTLELTQTQWEELPLLFNEYIHYARNQPNFGYEQHYRIDMINTILHTMDNTKFTVQEINMMKVFKTLVIRYMSASIYYTDHKMSDDSICVEVPNEIIEKIKEKAKSYDDLLSIAWNTQDMENRLKEALQ